MSDNSLNNKRIAKNTVLLFVRMIFTMGISLYTSRVVLRTLGVEDYGIYNVVAGVVSMFAFLSGTMAGSTQRFLTFEIGAGDNDKLHRVFCTSVIIHLIIAAIILVLAETVGFWFLNTQMNIPETRMDAANWVFQSVVLSTIIVFITVPYNASVIAHEKMSAFAYISILDAILKLAIVYLLCVFDFDKLKLYAVLMLSIQFLNICIYRIYCRKHFMESHFERIFDKDIFHKMLSFTGWSLFGGFSSVGFTQGINILLNIFFGPAVNAARGVAVQVQGAVSSFIANFQMALNPQITKSYASGDFDRMRKLVMASGRYSFYMMLVMVLPIVLEIEPILSVWLEEVPDYTANFVRLILCISLIDSLANPLIAAANATGNIGKYQRVVGTILLLIVPIAYVALKLGCHPEGVFICHLSMAVCAQIARAWMLRPMINFSIKRYVMHVIVRICVVGVGSSVIPFFIYTYLPKNTLSSFLAVCTVAVLCVLITVYTIGIDKTERDLCNKKILQIIKKVKG